MESLWFLVRDFEDVEEYSFGLKGGKKYMNEFLKSQNSNKAAVEHNIQRDYLKSTFEAIKCCLLPHPSRNIRKDSYVFAGLQFSYFLFSFQNLFYVYCHI